jgi:hypothetical protein
VRDPQRARAEYKALAAEITRRTEQAAAVERRRTEADLALERAHDRMAAELPVLNALDERAEVIWRELTTRFGADAAGPIPDPAPRVDPAGDAERLLRDAHQRVREPVHYPLGGRYAGMGLLGFLAAAALTLLGLLAAAAVLHAGGARIIVDVVAAVPALLGPLVGRLAAGAWIRWRTSHEERSYAEDTVVAGLVGGAGIWLIVLVAVVVKVVT